MHYMMHYNIIFTSPHINPWLSRRTSKNCLYFPLYKQFPANTASSLRSCKYYIMIIIVIITVMIIVVLITMIMIMIISHYISHFISNIYIISIWYSRVLTVLNASPIISASLPTSLNISSADWELLSYCCWYCCWDW